MSTITVSPSGTADDSGPIQAALDAAYGLADPTITTVVLSPGLYLLQTTVFIGSYTKLVATGATVRRNAAFDAELIRVRNTAPVSGYLGEHDWEINGGTWDGNRHNIGVGSNILSWAHCTTVTVRNAQFTGCVDDHCIEVNSTKTALVEDCVFTDSGSPTEAVQIDGAFGANVYPWFGNHDGTVCDGVTIQRCRFSGGIVDGIGSHTVVAGKPHRHVRIEDCDLTVTGIGLKLRGYLEPVLVNNRVTATTALEVWSDHRTVLVDGTFTLAPPPPEPDPLPPPTGGPDPMLICFYTNDGGSGQMSNAAAALTEIFGNGKRRTAASLSAFTQARVIANVTIAGAPTGRLALQVSANQGATWDYADGALGPDVNISAVGLRVGAWAALAAGLGDVWLRLVSVDGNGTADPAFGNLYAELR